MPTHPLARNMPNSLHGILLIDKPSSLTSNKVLQKIRYHLGKPKAGYAGILDPLATGMLPICFGRATKINQFLLDNAKCYTATLQFGIQSDSEDIDGNIIKQQDLSTTDMTLSTIRETLRRFIGKQEQAPPQYSALKHQGKPLYSYARRGIYIPKPKRSIHIYHLDIVSFEKPYLTLSVHCSKGTYIRSLVRDIGLTMGCGATLVKLRREWVKPFGNKEEGAKKMLLFDDLLSLSQKNIINNHLLSADTAILTLPAITLNEVEETKLKHGQTIRLSEESLIYCTTPSMCRVYNAKKQCIAVGQLYDDKLKSKKLL